MKTKNIPVDIKSKSLNEAKSEIKDILERLEKENMDLEASTNDYKRLLHLNDHVDNLFKKSLRKSDLLEQKLI